MSGSKKPDLKYRWSWAAFLGGSFWAVNHGLWTPLLEVAYVLLSVFAYASLEAAYWANVHAQQPNGVVYLLSSIAHFNLFYVVPLVFVAAHAYLGMHGERLAWRLFTKDEATFRRAQNRWTFLGAALMLVLAVLVVIALALLAALSFGA